MSKKNNQTVQAFIQLRAEGNSFDKISKQLDVSKQTLITWSKDHEIEIHNLRALHLDALVERFHMDREAELAILDKRYKAVVAEIIKREAQQALDISTKELYELWLKMSSHRQALAQLPALKSLEQELLPESFDCEVVKEWQP